MADTVASVILRMRDEASAAARGAAGEVRKLGDAAEDAAADLAQAGDAAGRSGLSATKFGDGAGKAGQGAAKLAGALSLVSPAAGGAARDLADVADVGEVAAAAAQALGVSGAALSGILAGVSAVVGGAYLAYRAWNEEGDRAAQVAEDVSKANASLRPMLEEIRDAYIDLAEARGNLTEVEAEGIRIGLKGMKDFQAATLETQRRIADLQAQRDSLSTHVVDMIEGWAAGNVGAALFQSALKGLTTSTAEYNEEIEANQGVIDGALAREKELVGVHRAVAAAQDKNRASTVAATAATKAQAAAEKAAADEAARLKAELDQLITDAQRWGEVNFGPQVDAAAEALGAFDAAMGGIDLTDAIDDTTALALAQADLALALSRGAISADQYEEAMGRLTAAQKELDDDPTAIDTATTVVGAVAAGPEGGLEALSTAGPIGAFIAFIVGVIKDLDETLDGFHEFHMDITSAIGNLGGTLADAIPEALNEGTQAAIQMIPDLIRGIIMDLIPAIIQAIFDVDFWSMLIRELVQAIGEILSTILEAIVGIIGDIWRGVGKLFSQDTWAAVGQWIAQAIKDIFGGWLGEDGKLADAGQSVGEWLKGAGQTVGGWFSKGYATGTDYVSQTGMALVHQGERIIPATGASSGRSATILGGQGGGDLHLHLPPGLVLGTADQLVRELNRALGTGNRGLAWATGA